MQSESNERKPLKLIIVGIFLGAVSLSVALAIQPWIFGPSEDLARIPPLPPVPKSVAVPETAAVEKKANDSPPGHQGGSETGDSIALEADDIETVMPAKIIDMKIAQGGRSIVLKLAGDSGLRIYDVTDQSLRKLELNRTDFVFGAGGEKIVVYVAETNTITVYDLKTAKSLYDRTFFDHAGIVGIFMGAGQDDKAFVVFSKVKDISRLDYEITILDLIRLDRDRNIGLGWKISDRFDLVSNFMRSGYDLQVMTSSRPDGSPHEFKMWKRYAWGYGVMNFPGETGYLAVGNDGRVYTGFGEIYEEAEIIFDDRHNIAERVKQFRNRSLFPSVTGQFFVSLGLNWDLNLHGCGITLPLGELRRFPGKIIPTRPEFRDSIPSFAKSDPMYTLMRQDHSFSEITGLQLTFDKRVTMIPTHDAIVFIPYSNDRLIARKMNLRKMMDQSGNHYCLVLSSPRQMTKAGREWTYEIKAIAKNEPLKFSIRQGPEKMTISDDGKVRWAVDSGLKGSTEVIIDITDSKGRVTPHPFTIWFD